MFWKRSNAKLIQREWPGALSLINFQAQRCASLSCGTNFHAFWARACARFARQRPGAHEWPLMNNKFSAFSQSWMGTPVAKVAKKAAPLTTFGAHTIENLSARRRTLIAKKPDRQMGLQTGNLLVFSWMLKAEITACFKLSSFQAELVSWNI